MEFTIYPAIGLPIVFSSKEYDYRFFNDISRIQLGAVRDVPEDCLLPVEIEVLWLSVVAEINGQEKKLNTDELKLSGYTFTAKLRPWDMEIIHGRDSIDRLECGASYLICDLKKRFFIHKFRDGLSVLFFKRDISDYLNLKELSVMHKEALEDYSEILETPFYDLTSKAFSIHMV